MRGFQSVVISLLMLGAAVLLLASCTATVDSAHEATSSATRAVASEPGQLIRVAVAAAAPMATPWVELALAALAAVNGLLAIASNVLHGRSQQQIKAMSEQLAASVPAGLVEPAPVVGPAKPTPGVQFP